MQHFKTGELQPGFDLTSVAVDPVYIDPSTGNYHPQNAAFSKKGLDPWDRV